MIYLDNAATTKPHPKVIEAVKYSMENKWFNPSANYDLGGEIFDDVKMVRLKIANLLNCSPDEIIFTSGASESNSLAIKGYLNKHPNSLWATTTIEHKSILLIPNHIDIPVNTKGLVEIDDIPSVDLYSVQMANNEIGTIQNIKAISSKIHQNNGILHTDATQAFGSVPINIKELGIDMLSASAHKFGGPKGIGFLYVKKGIDLEPIIYGEQENQLRGGTYNTYGIIGMGTALNYLNLTYKDRITDLRDYFIEKVTSNIKSSYLVGDQQHRLPNNINICFMGIDAETLKILLEEDNIYVSTQSACNSKNIEPSHVLQAIKLNEKDQRSCIRFSLNENTTQEELDFVIQKLILQVKLLQEINQCTGV